jgi:hypothetical protein
VLLLFLSAGAGEKAQLCAVSLQGVQRSKDKLSTYEEGAMTQPTPFLLSTLFFCQWFEN